MGWRGTEEERPALGLCQEVIIELCQRPGEEAPGGLGVGGWLGGGEGGTNRLTGGAEWSVRDAD